MRETGIIKSINNEIVIIKLEKSDNCANCGLCSSGLTENEIIAYNKINAKIGDRVLVDITSKVIISFTFFIYVFPILCAIAGYFIFFYFFKKNEGLGIIGSLICLIISFLSILLKKRKNEIAAEIVEIL